MPFWRHACPARGGRILQDQYVIRDYELHGKQIFVFKEHNLAPQAWRQCRPLHGAPPALLTFDHHTDTHLAFLRHMHQQRGGMTPIPWEECVGLANALTSGFRDAENLEQAVQLLRNDEHIDFAIRAGILSHAYVISHDTNPQFEIRSVEYQRWFEEKIRPENLMRGVVPPRPEDRTYHMPSNNILSLGNDHFSKMGIYTEEDRQALALDDRNLAIRMAEIGRIDRALFPAGYDFRNNFILDIDLDYFNTQQSIQPRSPAIFFDIIRRSRIITIATEDDFVLDCRLDGETVTAEGLLEQVMQLVDRALQP